MAGIEVEEKFYDSYDSVLSEEQDADTKTHSTPIPSGVHAIPPDPIPSIPDIAQTQVAPLSNPTGRQSFSCQNGTSYPSTNDDVKLGKDNSVIDVDKDDDKDETESLSAYGRTQTDKATALVGLTQVQRHDVDQKHELDQDPNLLGAEGNQLDNKDILVDQDTEDSLTVKFESLFDAKRGIIPTTIPTDLSHLAQPMVKSDSDKIDQAQTGQIVRPKTGERQSLQIGDRATPYVSQARYVTTRPDTTYKDRIDQIRSVRFDSNIEQDTFTDDEKTDSNDTQDNSSRQDKGSAFVPTATQTDKHDLGRNLDVPQVDGAADRTADRTDRLEDNMKRLVDMQNTVQHQIQNLTVAIAPIGNMSDELERIQADLRAMSNQNRLSTPVNAYRLDQSMPANIPRNTDRIDQSMPVIRPVDRIDQPMSTQTSSVQGRQPVQTGNDIIRSVESVNNQQTNTSPNSTLDYPPPSLREGAVNSHEVSCISLGTMENIVDYTRRLCPLPIQSRKNCHYYKMTHFEEHKRPCDQTRTQYWRNWREQYMRFAVSQGWHAYEAANMIAMYTTGKAQELVSNCSEEQKRDFNFLMNRLDAYFCPAAPYAEASARFTSRTYKVGFETYMQFLQDICMTFREMYPSISPDVEEKEIRKKFLDGCRDSGDYQFFLSLGQDVSVHEMAKKGDYMALQRASSGGNSSATVQPSQLNTFDFELVDEDDSDVEFEAFGGDQNRFRNMVRNWQPNWPRGPRKQVVRFKRKPRYDPCKYCGRTNHPSDRCYSKQQAFVQGNGSERERSTTEYKPLDPVTTNGQKMNEFIQNGNEMMKRLNSMLESLQQKNL